MSIYQQDISLFKITDDGWKNFAEFVNSETLENLISRACGDWKVFNQSCNHTYRMIAIYLNTRAEEVSKLDCKEWSFSN